MREKGGTAGDPPEGLTYAAAGVDIEAANQAVALLQKIVRRTFRPEVLAEIGGFGGLCALPSGYREPVLVAGTDGVGTKLRVAFMCDRHETIGIDAVAMCVNDVLVCGAEPLFFLDYLAVGRLVPEQVAAVVSGVARGCEQAGCALIGGETAEMPGFYAPGEYDIAGFAVGVVERSRIVDGKRISPGDIVVGLPSSGIHSNGLSLARKVLFEVLGYGIDTRDPLLGRTVGEELLEPTRIYVRTVLSLLKRFDIRGMAHITGGGLTENIPRVLPRGVGVVLRSGSWPVPPVFRLIQEHGGVTDGEMLRTFNMGIGYILIAPGEEAQDLLEALAADGEPAYIIGWVENDAEGVVYNDSGIKRE
ncbi:MAG: phosphoribosylformylglycinamidine cyclo-ligase [Bacillota bacterium]